MITVENLNFGYNRTPFLREVNFTVNKGEILGILGPSGAGKSTLQKIMIGMLPRYSGSVTIGGREVKTCGNELYERIGVDFEFSTLYEKLTARQNLRFAGSLYRGPLRDIDALLSEVGLLPSAGQKTGEFSKGMKNRLNFIKALLHDPELLFLDEPTSGLDPNNAQVIKSMILKEKAAGKTVLLTTHNMQDAAELCDRVAFIVDGQLRALDTPRNFTLRKGAGSVTYTYRDGEEERAGDCPLTETAADQQLAALIAQNRLLTIHSREQTLGDVFMELTGRVLA